MLGTVVCCALTDMRCEHCRSRVSDHAHAVWNAPDRAAAIEAARGAQGEDGSRMVEMASQLAPSDAALLTDPAWLSLMRAELVPAMFAYGFEGYADDRIADGPGWTTFDVASVICPVIVLHGAEDAIVDPMQARHTVDSVPGAQLRIVEGLAHFSVMKEIVATLVDLFGERTLDA